MKTIAVFLAGALLCGPIVAVEQVGNTYTFSDADMARCEAEGGCVQVSMKSIGEAMQQVRDQALAECPSRTIWKAGK